MFRVQGLGCFVDLLAVMMGPRTQILGFQFSAPETDFGVLKLIYIYRYMYIYLDTWKSRVRGSADVPLGSRSQQV